MKERNWILGNESVDEIQEYNKVVIVKHIVFSSSNVDKNKGKI